jgi:hypothetical protein
LNERFLQAQANFKSTLVRMLNNQEEERVSSEFVDFIRGLRHNVESATTLEPIEAVVNEISKSVYFAGSTKAKLKEELSMLNSYQELIQLFNIALSIQQSMQQQDREKLQDQLTAIPPQRLAQLLYWPEISSMIAGSPYIVERLFQYAFEKRDIGVLTKLLEERVVSTDRVLTSLQDPDCTDEDLLFCYISLALAGFEDSVLLLQNNFEVFQSAIEKMRDGFYGDIAQWLFVHHQIHVGLEDASEHDRALSNKMVFSELLKLSDRDHSKIIMLQKFGEIVSQTGKGFNGQYSALKTPFLLLLEMFGESIFTQSQDTYLFQRTTYLPLASATRAQGIKDESIKPESDIEVSSSALRQRK